MIHWLGIFLFLLFPTPDDPGCQTQCTLLGNSGEDTYIYMVQGEYAGLHSPYFKTVENRLVYRDRKGNLIREEYLNKRDYRFNEESAAWEAAEFGIKVKVKDKLLSELPATLPPICAATEYWSATFSLGQEGLQANFGGNSSYLVMDADLLNRVSEGRRTDETEGFRTSPVSSLEIIAASVNLGLGESAACPVLRAYHWPHPQKEQSSLLLQLQLGEGEMHNEIIVPIPFVNIENTFHRYEKTRASHGQD